MSSAMSDIDHRSFLVSSPLVVRKGRAFTAVKGTVRGAGDGGPTLAAAMRSTMTPVVHFVVGRLTLERGAPVMVDTTPPAGQSAESETPERRLSTLLAAEERLTVSAAESCSGGEVAHRITAVAGCSAYFLGSVVAYANAAKRDLLGVPDAVLEDEGAVSGACAAAMAEGARRAFGADVAVATTGIAGPGGATARKPVGLVYLAVAGPRGTVIREHRFSGDRAAVVAATAEAALLLLLEGVGDALADRSLR